MKPTRPLLTACLLAALLALTALFSSSHAAGRAQADAPPLPATGQFAGISCPSKSRCWAAGIANPVSPGQLEMARWNGQAWTSVPSPIAASNAPGDITPNALSSFTCVAKTSCWAIGSTSNKNLILRWNGRQWSVTWSSGYERLKTVTCASAANCWAVGTWLAHTGQYAGRYATWFGQILHWNGQTWTVVPSPNPSKGTNGYSNGVSSVACATASLCWAVGAYVVQTNVPVSMPEILRWNGTRWSLVEIPDAAGGLSFLTTAACSSKAECWAFGTSKDDGTALPHLVALHWKGTSWSAIPSANVPALFPEVIPNEVVGEAGMSCASAANCWVMGSYYPGPCSPRFLPIAIHWDGHAWSNMVSSLPAGALPVGVAMLTAKNGWAVGKDGDGSQAIFQWNGTGWSVLPHQPAAGSGGSGCGAAQVFTRAM